MSSAQGDSSGGVAEQNDKIIEELTCPICLDVFSDPRVLHCMHSACLACIRPLVKSGCIECPLCKKPTFLQGAGPDGLGRNLIAMALAEKFGGVKPPKDGPAPAAAGPSSGGAPQTIYAQRADSPPPNVAPYSEPVVGQPVQVPYAGCPVHPHGATTYPPQAQPQLYPNAAQHHHHHQPPHAHVHVHVPYGIPVNSAPPGSVGGVPVGTPLYSYAYGPTYPATQYQYYPGVPYPPR
eukprot:tig00020614_g12188.t1